MLEVAIHHGDHGSGARQYPFDTCPGEAAPPDPADAPDPAILRGDFLDERGCAARTVGIEKDDPPRPRRENAVDTGDQLSDVLPFIERWNNDREHRRGSRR